MKKRWWNEKVAYQIYPKSFKDSNKDGVGDLRGIIEKLDYLKDLGIDIVWISPIYQSPFVDQGYDISDYYAIDPIFGTMEDMDELIAEAKKRDMHIVMDLVVNHCSDKHEWFQKAMEDPYGEYGKYFYIMEGKDGLPPTNWRSYFGGSVWEKVPGYDNLFYLHMFAKEQPDLNWENPVVREEIYKNIRWWLEKGISGFRIDAIINIKKALPFCDYPVDEEGRSDGLCNAFVMLEHAEGLHEFLQEMKREAFDPYHAFTIGELFNFRPEELEQYIGDEGCFESIFDFSTHLIGASQKGWYDCKKVTAEQYKNVVFRNKKASQEIGMMANIIENHDEPRGVSHYLPKGDVNETSKKMLGGLMMMFYGLPFLYQGQEIGMENMVFENIDDVDDINTIDEFNNTVKLGYSKEEALKLVSARSRDNTRTPVQWDDSEHAGFTGGTPWMKVNPNYTVINVKEQQMREESVLSFYKEMIDLRKNSKYKDTIVYGKQIPVFEEVTNLIAFYREGEESTLLVLANWENAEKEVTLREEVNTVVVNNCIDLEMNGNKVRMNPYQFLVFEVDKRNV